LPSGSIVSVTSQLVAPSSPAQIAASAWLSAVSLGAPQRTCVVWKSLSQMVISPDQFAGKHQAVCQHSWPDACSRQSSRAQDNASAGLS
jgi:hypothetical protein